MVRADTAAWKRLIADTFVFTGAKGEYSEATKSKVLGWFKSGTVKFSRYQTEDVKIRILTNTAIVTSIETLEGTVSGEKFTAHVRTTMVWETVNRRWQLVAQQRTTVPPEG